MTEKHETVLVVDDEPMILTIARRILERAGYSVLTARSGRAALEICECREDPIDLLLTDTVMPGMNGVELAHCVADHKRDVPTLFMAAYAEESEAMNLLTSQPAPGGHSLIYKPFRTATVVDRIREMLTRSLVSKSASSA